MCYLVVQYADGVYLEKMNFAPGVKDDWNTFEYCIDRKVTENELVSVAYDSTERRTALRFLSPAGGRHACHRQQEVGDPADRLRFPI